MISLFNLVLMASCLAVTHGMRCYIGEETIASQLTKLSCPRPLLDDSTKSYCCIDRSGEFYCCNLFEFAMIYIIIAVVIVVVLSIVCSIICCFCCPCCFFYKRRHAGNKAYQEPYQFGEEPEPRNPNHNLVDENNGKRERETEAYGQEIYDL